MITEYPDQSLQEFIARRYSTGSGWQDLRRRLEAMSDEELTDLYYKLRDARQISPEGRFYPNIQILCATPFEREKDRREQRRISDESGSLSEVVNWYRQAREKSCDWWLENHVIARHALSSCMSCGACTALCPAAEFYEFNPRTIMSAVQEKDEAEIVELLKSDTIWYCHQCGSCKTKCPRQNSPFGMISSLRQLSQLKGYHIHSVRGRQQYFARHFWGGNLWNRACTLYFRNPDPESHKDFGPRFAAYFQRKEEYMRRIGAHPDMDGYLSGRKVQPETLEELRTLWTAGGALYLWSCIEEAAEQQAADMGMTIDEYLMHVMSEG